MRVAVRTPARPAARPRDGVRPFVLVTGGKGGVGKTTLAANLAVLLAEESGGAPGPLLIDLDFGLANLDVLLGLEPERSSEDYLAGRASLEECLVEGPAGLRFLPAGSGSLEMGRPDPVRRRKLLDGLADLALRPRLLVGDSAAGIGPDVLDFAVRADRVVVVTTPDPAALTDAYGLVKALDAQAREEGLEVPTPHVFVNLAADAEEARRVAAGLRAVCERFLARSPDLAGWMPRCRAARDGAASRRPFVLGDPRSLAARGVRQLARRFAPLMRDGAESGKEGGAPVRPAQASR